MNFLIGFILFIDWNGNNYDAILVIVNQLIKIVHYKVSKTTIDNMRLANMVINVVMRYYSFLMLIISACDS